MLRHDTKISDVEVDPGGGALVTPEHFEGAGSDSHPMPGDYVATTKVPRSGGVVAVGYLDPKAPQIAVAGEKMIYARDANGDLIARIHLKNDGTVLVSNVNGSIELKPDGEIVSTSPLATFTMDVLGSIKGANGNGDFELESGGDFVVNGVIISAAGSMTIPAGQTIVTPSIGANGIEVVDHVHLDGNPSEGDTGPMKA